MKNLIAIILLTGFAISGCIGTDIVEEVIVPEEVSITASIDSLMVGDSFMFSADYFDELGRRTEEIIDWSSSNPAIIDINSEGVASALSPGNVFIRAAVGTASDSVMVNSGEVTSVVANQRSGSFQGLSNYIVQGDFTLTDTGNELELAFAENFRTSNGPGLFIYLSNSATSVTGGIELGRIRANSGMQTYTISKDQAQLNTFSHVVVYCQPFRLAFGFGEFRD